jgi:hypothetical protein
MRPPRACITFGQNWKAPLGCIILFTLSCPTDPPTTTLDHLHKSTLTLGPQKQKCLSYPFTPNDTSANSIATAATPLLYICINQPPQCNNSTPLSPLHHSTRDYLTLVVLFCPTFHPAGNWLPGFTIQIQIHRNASTVVCCILFDSLKTCSNLMCSSGFHMHIRNKHDLVDVIRPFLFFCLHLEVRHKRLRRGPLCYTLPCTGNPDTHDTDDTIRNIKSACVRVVFIIATGIIPTVAKYLFWCGNKNLCYGAWFIIVRLSPCLLLIQVLHTSQSHRDIQVRSHWE